MACSDKAQATESQQSSDGGVSVGEFARLTSESEVVVVTGIAEKQAADYEIEALAGRTVAQEHSRNDEVSPDDAVVEVVFPSSVNYYAENSPELSGWSAGSLAEMRADGALEETGVTVYSYPESLIEGIDMPV